MSNGNRAHAAYARQRPQAHEVVRRFAVRTQLPLLLPGDRDHFKELRQEDRCF